MGQVCVWCKNGLLFAGFALLVVAGLLIFAMVAVAVRPLLIVGFVVAGIGALVLSHFSPGFREWFKAVGEPEVRLSGLRLATDVDVHPSHSWARILPEGVAAGADDFVQAALGPVDEVELPAVGSRVKQGDRLFSLRRGDRRVNVRAPVSGTVLTRNESLLECPWLVNQQPFHGGWAVRLRADNARVDRQRLLQGNRARGWLRQEVDRLIAAVEDNHTTLQDGGALVSDLHRHIDDRAWQRVAEMFFGDQPND